MLRMWSTFAPPRDWVTWPPFLYRNDAVRARLGVYPGGASPWRLFDCSWLEQRASLDTLKNAAPPPPFRGSNIVNMLSIKPSFQKYLPSGKLSFPVPFETSILTLALKLFASWSLGLCQFSSCSAVQGPQNATFRSSLTFIRRSSGDSFHHRSYVSPSSSYESWSLLGPRCLSPLWEAVGISEGLFRLRLAFGTWLKIFFGAAPKAGTFDQRWRPKKPLKMDYIL